MTASKKTSPMVRLTASQLKAKLAFMQEYIKAPNAATGAILDPNANVSQKNISTLHSEIHKDINIQINRALMHDKITTLYGEELADEYIRQLESHEIYKHDETSLYPYCVSITMYPYLLHGTTLLGGSCDSPHHLDSFCGSFLNLVYEVAAQFAGAVATPEWLLCFDHFARKDYGDNYLEERPDVVRAGFASAVYGLNEPAAARNYQAVFWNISLFDQHYFEHLFGDFVFPDMDRPKWETFKKLQAYFLEWFNKERERKVLTFPVVTVARLDDGQMENIDEEFLDLISKEASEGNAFFTYTSPTVDSLASCCRLRNALDSSPQFSYSLGAGGVATGSISVMTLNLNRLEQDAHRNLSDEIAKLHKYQMAYRSLIQDKLDEGMLPVYTAGFISLDKQFSTIGLSGIADAAEAKGLVVGSNPEYIAYCQETLKTIYDANQKMTLATGCKFNTEFVPGESLGVKFAKWDKEAGYVVNRNCYNSYFYLPEDATCDIADKFALHGEEVVQYLDGGSALHLNLESYPTAEGYRSLFRMAARMGTNYFCTNIPVTVCKECGKIHKLPVDLCPFCGSENVAHATRVIGFLKEIPSFSTDRQEEAEQRVYHKLENVDVNE